MPCLEGAFGRAPALRSALAAGSRPKKLAHESGVRPAGCPALHSASTAAPAAISSRTEAVRPFAAA